MVGLSVGFRKCYVAKMKTSLLPKFLSASKVGDFITRRRECDKGTILPLWLPLVSSISARSPELHPKIKTQAQQAQIAVSDKISQKSYATLNAVNVMKRSEALWKICIWTE